MVLKLKALEGTRSFYKWELEKEDLTEKERDKCLRALKLIEEFIEKKEIFLENDLRKIPYQNERANYRGF